jgi:signal transduction histidine kinase/ligand-binding sensor domain-containing protein
LGFERPPLQLRMTHKYVITGIAVLICTLHFTVQAQQFSIRKYTAVDGLPQSEVRAMVEDRHGYLWLATQGGGLARFDGREFKVYTTLDGLLSNIVTTLLIDTTGNIWMAHPRGITKFDGQTFTKFIQPTGDAGARRIRRIYQRGDSIFFVTHPGVIGKIYQDSVHYWSKQIIPDKNIFFTYVKPGKAIVHYLNDSSFLYYYNLQQRILSHKGIFSQTKNVFSYGNEIAIKSEDAYYRLDLQNNRLVKLDIPIWRHIIFYDSTSQDFWTRSENKLFKEKISGDKITSELIYDGVEIAQVLPDHEGNTWIGSLGEGLIRYFNRDFDKCSSDNLRMVMAIAKDSEGAMWIGSGGNGLWRMSKGKISTYKLPTQNDGVTSIKIGTDGTVYVSGKSGLGVYDEKKDAFKWLNRSDGLSSSYISTLEPDNAGGIWAGTVMGGLNYYKNGKATIIDDKVNLKTKNIASLKFIPTTQSLFIGTDFGLVELKRDGTTSNVSLPEFDNTTIYSLNTYRDSLLLIGSGGAGFAVFNPKTKKKRVITPKEGLSSGFVFFVAPDDQDYVWIGTVNGISRMKLTPKGDIVEHLHYGYDNGLAGIESNQNAFFFDAKEKYFGLIDGLYQFNDFQGKTFKTFPTHLTGIEILFGQEPLDRYGSRQKGFFKIPSHLSLPYNKNHITFHFNKVDKRNPQSIRYKYFLENFDMAWSHPTAVGEVTYGSLPPGRYTLKVIATNKDGSWENLPMTYSFTVLTPFYQTAWFIGFVFLIVAGAILFGIMYRVRSRVAKVMEVERIRQQEQEALRKEIARDFHDEMGNQLTRIINYVSLLKLSSNGHAHDSNGQLNGLGELFNKVEASAKNLYTGTRDFIWAIDPLNDELSQLFIHLRDFGVKLFEEKSISFRANNNVGDSVRLPYGFSREANLVFKEAMTNAFKHSQAKNVTLTMSKMDDSFLLELVDDGVGFSYSTITMNGLKNIRGRAERIKAKLAIDGGPGMGTKVTLTFGLEIKQKKKVKQ